MPNHQASEQMLGYLYQVRYALALLLENDNSDFQISIEKFDDVAFSKDGMPKQLIQLKHHIQRQGSLTDGSTDLWRTLKVWIDVLSDSPDILDGTEFLIVTTAIAPDGTAASYLKKGKNRNAERAYEKLKDVCNGVQREHNKKLNNGLPILHKVPPKRDYGRYFCIMAEKGETSHGGLTEKLSLFFHAKKQEVNAYGR